MSTAPKIPDVTGRYGKEYTQLGREFQANAHRIGINGVSELIGAASAAARYYRQKQDEDTPDDRIYKIDTEKEIDRTLAKIGSDNRLNPENFDTAAEQKLDELLENVPDKHKQWFMEKYSERRNGYAHTVNINTEENKYNRQLEGFMQHSEELRAQAMNYAKQGNQAAYNETLAKWQENEEYMYNHGFMSIHSKISRLQDFTNGAIVEQQTGYAKQLFGNSGKLEAQIKSIENSGKYTPEQKKSILNSIKGEYSSWQAKNKVGNDELSATADFGIKAYNAGIEPKDFNAEETLQKLTDKGLMKKAAELQNAIKNKQVTATFAGLNPLQMDNSLREMKKNATTKEDLDLIKTLETLKDKAETQLNSDPLAFALDHGVVDSSGLDFNKPESVAARVQSAKIVQEKYSLPYAPLLTKAETKTLSNTLQRANAAERAAIVSTLAENFGDDAGSIFADIAPKNPEVAVAGKIYNSRPDVAVSIIEGKEIKEKEGGYAPTKNINLYNALGKVDSALSNFDTEDVANVKEAIIAQATYLNKKNNIFGEGDASSQSNVDEDTINQAITDVLGAQIVTMDKGLHWWGDNYNTVLPENASKSYFEDWIKGLKDSDIGKAYVGDYKVSTDTIKKEGEFRYNSRNTYMIFWNGEPVTNEAGEPIILQYGGK